MLSSSVLFSATVSFVLVVTSPESVSRSASQYAGAPRCAPLTRGEVAERATDGGAARLTPELRRLRAKGVGGRAAPPRAQVDGRGGSGWFFAMGHRRRHCSAGIRGYGHEFSWDRERDPVWKRLQTIFGFYQEPGNLAFTHGRGGLRGQPPDATHCTHIGPPHRKLIHEAFAKWSGY